MRRVVFPALLSIFLLNCNRELPTPADSAGEAEGARAAGAALAVPDRIYTDGSGDMRVLVRTCDYLGAAASGKHCSYCALDAGWVMIGGGAEIEGSPSSARLRASFPRPSGVVPPVSTPDGLEHNCTGNSPSNDIGKDLIAWMARSDGSSQHRLRAYVVGLQINGLTEQQLSGYRSFNDQTTAPMTQPVREAASFSGLIVGGGVDEVGSQNCYLTESRPVESTNAWRGSAYCATPGSIKVYTIGIDACPTVPGWEFCLQSTYRTLTGGSGTGYGSASGVTPYPMVVSSIGGRGVVNLSSSRFLVDMIPLAGSNQGVTVNTKDQGVSVNGATTAYSVHLLGGRWGLWRWNSIRFNDAGTTLHRPSGTAPVALMQSTAYPNAGPYRWHLEDLGGGQFRIRNSNPTRPASGECAYRQVGTSNLLVGPCNSTNEHKWTTIVHPKDGPFQLRNISSSTCLDNNNSRSNSVLRLVPCVSGYSARQSFFLDNFGWPP